MERREQILSEYHVLGKLNEHGLTSMVKTAMADYAHSVSAYSKAIQPTPAQEQTVQQYEKYLEDKFIGQDQEAEGSQCKLSDTDLCNVILEQVQKLASTGGKSWSLQVPVNFNKDPDMLICELVKRFKSASPSPVSRTGMSLPTKDEVISAIRKGSDISEVADNVMKLYASQTSPPKD